jgi:amino acid adenylation domain-containing protein
MPEIRNGAETEEGIAEETLAAMSAAAFLRYLRGLDVELRARDGKLALNAPAGVVTPLLQQMLRSRKAELLAELEAREAAEEEVAPLTYAQQRLWLVERFAPQTAVYNIPQAWVVEGEVEEGALRRAVAKLAERHAALRTCIEVREGGPVQVVLREAAIPLRIVDLTAVGTEEEERAQIELHLRRAGQEAFHLDHAPLIRFQLLHLPRQRSLVSYDVHHIVSDQRSLDVLKRDLQMLYLAELDGKPAALAPLQLSYAQVAEREHSQGVARLHEEQLSYWRARLAAMPTLLELPFAKGRKDGGKAGAGKTGADKTGADGGEGQSQAGTTLRMQAGEALTQALRQLAVDAKTSLYMVMLSAFAALLHRYTGESDLCIGTPLTGRKRREEEELVGLFVNLVPLRCRVAGEESFAKLVQRTSAQVLLDFEQGDVPFQKLVMELHPQRSMAHSPLFQVMFSMTPRDTSGQEERLEETFLSVAKFDVTMQVVERARGMDLYLEYRTDLYADEDMEQFGRHYGKLLEAISASAETAVEALSLITEEDTRLFAAWNATEVAFDRSMTLADLVEAQARWTPDAIALRWKGGTLSYDELNRRAVRLAAVLQRHGAGREEFVGLCLTRTPWLIVAMLAIHKAGAAYLPLDPKYPLERLQYMLEDSGAALVVTERGLWSELEGAELPKLRVIFADEVEDGESTPGERAKPEDAAYLIYTSGSTGKPKGVVIEHRNAAALIAWAKGYLEPEALEGMLASTSVSFDLSVFEIFLPLATGKTIVLMDDVLELNRSAIAETVTLINTVPSAMQALLQAGLPKSVTTVCLAGEFLPAELVDRIYDAGVKRVFDLYGPTETTTYSTCVLRKRGEAATLGGPLGNTQIYLLDEGMRLVPPGVWGEIYIGGEGVARGYLGRPELTQEKFVYLPGIHTRAAIDTRSEIDPSGRLYRTGDIARRRYDGALIFMGRRDSQVKLRGHRIELGEVEAALREVSGATEVAVVVSEAGDTLLAYAETADASAEFARNEMTRAWMESLRRRLPAYMVPASITMLMLPRTPNGKIDRKTLRARIDDGVPARPSEDESPRDLLEQWLANIWAHRLGVSRVTRHAHFFEELGGHSLAAFEIFAEIESKMGMAMMLATLFQAPTVAQLAAAMRRLGWREPVQVQMVAASTSAENAGRVVYIRGPIEERLPDGSRMDGVRVMKLADGIGAREAARWIDDFEVSRPELILQAQESSRDFAKELSEALVRMGWPARLIRAVE